jgi:hypothetical protein
MIRLPSRGFLAASLAVLVVSGYCVYLGRNRAPVRARQELETASRIAGPDRATASSDAAAAPPTVLPETRSLLQLHSVFRESQQCLEERTVIRGNESYNLNATPPLHIPGCDDMKGALRKVYAATTAAAKAGDADAQMCYLMQAAGDRESGFQLSDAEIAEYYTLAPRFIDAAFQRGDWRVIVLLGFHVVDSPGLFIGLEQWKDPSREYKAHQLFLLGAGDVNPQESDDWLVALRQPELKDNWRLSASEIQDSNAWAQEMYDKYFNSQPKLLQEPGVCTAQDAG